MFKQFSFVSRSCALIKESLNQVDLYVVQDNVDSSLVCHSDVTSVPRKFQAPDCLTDASLTCAGHLASFLPLKIPGPAAEGSSSDLTPAGSLNTVGQGQFHGMPGGDGQQQQLLMRHIVALEGYSRIETVVTLLAWALMVQEAAK